MSGGRHRDGECGDPRFCPVWNYASQQGCRALSRKVCERCEDARSCRRRTPGFHAFGAGCRASRCPCGFHSGDRWNGRRPVARREDTNSTCRYRIRSQFAGNNDSTICERCTNHSRCTRGLLGRRSSCTSDQIVMATTIIDGITTRYEVIGSGPPLLMFSPAGFDATLEKWATQSVYATTKMLEHLSKSYSCIIYD